MIVAILAVYVMVVVVVSLLLFCWSLQNRFIHYKDYFSVIIIVIIIVNFFIYFNLLLFFYYFQLMLSMMPSCWQSSSAWSGKLLKLKFQLSWKLAFVVRSHAGLLPVQPPELLKSIECERLGEKVAVNGEWESE